MKTCTVSATKPLVTNTLMQRRWVHVVVNVGRVVVAAVAIAAGVAAVVVVVRASVNVIKQFFTSSLMLLQKKLDCSSQKMFLRYETVFQQGRSLLLCSTLWLVY